MGLLPDGLPDRKHIRRKSKAELALAVRELERSRDTGQYTWGAADQTLGTWLGECPCWGRGRLVQ